MREKIFEFLRNKLAEKTGFEKSAITMETNLLDDLMADSIVIVELISDLEVEYNIYQPDDVILSLFDCLPTVDSMVTWTEGKINELSNI